MSYYSSYGSNEANTNAQTGTYTNNNYNNAHQHGGKGGKGGKGRSVSYQEHDLLRTLLQERQDLESKASHQNLRQDMLKITTEAFAITLANHQLQAAPISTVAAPNFPGPPPPFPNYPAPPTLIQPNTDMTDIKTLLSKLVDRLPQPITHATTPSPTKDQLKTQLNQLTVELSKHNHKRTISYNNDTTPTKKHRKITFNYDDPDSRPNSPNNRDAARLLFSLSTHIEINDDEDDTPSIEPTHIHLIEFFVTKNDKQPIFVNRLTALSKKTSKDLETLYSSLNISLHDDANNIIKPTKSIKIHTIMWKENRDKIR